MDNSFDVSDLIKKISHDEILIVGAVRNCSETVKEDLQRFWKATKNFSKTYTFLVESDSDDDTLSVLEELKSETPLFDYVSFGALREKHALRTERLAICRNAYLDTLRNDKRFSNVKYVFMVDLDGVSSNINEDVLLSCWIRSDWAACFANQDGPYYDIWALRHEFWSPNDCLEQYAFLKHLGVPKRKAFRLAVTSKMIKLDKNMDWIEVDSAFGGLGIYKREFLVDAHYVGITPQKTEVCEHVALHRDIKRQGGRLFINPQMCNTIRTEYTQSVFSIRRWVDFIRRHVPAL